MDIDPRYKIICDCKHERWYFSCPVCGTKTDPFTEEPNPDFVFRHICGIDGNMFVVECPKCYHRYKFHCWDNGYEIFVRTVNKGINLHFKSISEEDEIHGE